MRVEKRERVATGSTAEMSAANCPDSEKERSIRKSVFSVKSAYL